MENIRQASSPSYGWNGEKEAKLDYQIRPLGSGDQRIDKLYKDLLEQFVKIHQMSTSQIIGDPRDQSQRNKVSWIKREILSGIKSMGLDTLAKDVGEKLDNLSSDQSGSAIGKFQEVADLLKEQLLSAKGQNDKLESLEQFIKDGVKDSPAKGLAALSQKLTMMRNEQQFQDGQRQIQSDKMRGILESVQKSNSMISRIGLETKRFMQRQLTDIKQMAFESLMNLKKNIFDKIAKVIFTRPGVFVMSLIGGLLYGLIKKAIASLRELPSKMWDWMKEKHQELKDLLSNYMLTTRGALDVLRILRHPFASFKILKTVTKFAFKTLWRITSGIFKFFKFDEIFKLDKIIDAIKGSEAFKKVEKVFEEIHTKYTKMLDGVKNSKIYKWFEDLPNELHGKYEKALESVKNSETFKKFEAIFEQIRGKYHGILESITNSPIVKGVKEFIEDLKGMFNAGKTGETLKRIFDPILGVFRGFGETISNVVGPVFNTLKKMVEPLFGLFTKNAGKIAKVGKGVGKLAGKAAAGVSGVASVAFVGLDAYETYDKFKQGDILGGIVKSLVTALDVVALIPVVGGVAGALSGIIDLTYEVISGFGDRIMAFFQELPGVIWDKITGAWNAFMQTDFGKSTDENIIKPIKERIDAIMTHINTLVNAIQALLEKPWIKPFLKLCGYESAEEKADKAAKQKHSDKIASFVDYNGVDLHVDQVRKLDRLERQLVLSGGITSRFKQLHGIEERLKNKKLDEKEKELLLKMKSNLQGLVDVFTEEYKSDNNFIVKSMQNAHAMKNHGKGGTDNWEDLTVEEMQKTLRDLTEQVKNDQKITEQQREERLIEIQKSLKILQKGQDDVKESVDASVAVGSANLMCTKEQADKMNNQPLSDGGTPHPNYMIPIGMTGLPM